MGVFLAEKLETLVPAIGKQKSTFFAAMITFSV